MTRALKVPRIALESARIALARVAVGAIAERLQRFEGAAAGLARQDPRARIAAWRARIALAAKRLPVVGMRAVAAKRAAGAAAMRELDLGCARYLARRRTQLDVTTARLRALGPRRTLARGYAIVYDAAGNVLTDAARTSIGESIGVELKSGSLAARVTKRDVHGKDNGEAD